MYVHIHASVSSFLHCCYLTLDVNCRKEKNPKILTKLSLKAFAQEMFFFSVQLLKERWLKPKCSDALRINSLCIKSKM